VPAIPVVGSPVDDDEVRRLRDILSEAFVCPTERSQAYLESAGPETVRVVRLEGDVAGGLVVLPKGQWFGGRSVPMAGVAAVAVAPEHRARGAATTLLRAVLEEQREAGTPISALYPATVALYRRVGYELAGVQSQLALPAKAIDVRDRELSVRVAGEEDEQAVRGVYRDWARGINGQLDRSEFNWQRVHNHRGDRTQGYLFCGEGGVEGYAFVLTRGDHPPAWHVRMQDAAATTPPAARRIWSFLADFRTIRDEVHLCSSPTDPLLMHLAEVPYRVVRNLRWMLRLVDVENALAVRGYPAGVSGELHLDVRDEVLPANHGRVVLQVTDGAGHVQAGGRGSFRVDVRGLAALYTGYLGPQELILAGLADAGQADCALAGSIFAGALPWMRDEF
jgi:predicted acetyltransferase